MGIENTGGQWRSKRTTDEIKSSLKAEWDRFSPEERRLILEAMREVETGGQSKIISAARKAEYEEEPVSPRQFFSDPYYVGEIASEMNPLILDDLCDIFENDYHEVILGGAIGWGKTTSAVLILFRMLYEALCLINPQRSYGLASGSKIHFVNLSIRVDIAKKVLFEQITDRMREAGFFQKIGFVPTKEEIKFPKGISVMAGASNDTGIIGMNVFGAILDEGNFFANVRGGVTQMPDGSVVDRAERIYHSIMRRMKARYQKAGKVPGVFVICSSKRRSDDFTERRLRLLKEKDEKHVFVREYSLWAVKKTQFDQVNKFKVFVGNEVSRSKLLATDEKIVVPEGCQIIDVPLDLKDEFDRDLDGSIRDIAGIATTAIEPFIPMREKLLQMVDRSFRHPFADFEWVAGTPLRPDWHRLFRSGPETLSIPICCPNSPRHAHIDPSLNHCATGFAVGHICGARPVQRREGGVSIMKELPVIRFDVILRILPPQGEEIVLSDICSLVMLLYKQGMPIYSVSMDSWQSAGPLQELAREGFETKVISTQKDMHAYDLLKQAIYEERVRTYEYPPLQLELRQLEFNRKTNRVTFPSGGHKDVADAVAGVAFQLTNKPPSAGAPPPLQGVSEFPMDDAGVSYGAGGNILWTDEESESQGDSGETDMTAPFLLG